MNYCILDLEFNSAFSKRDKRFINEIIEFGAVKTDEKLNIIDTFSMLINPQIGKKLNFRVKELTHLTNEQLKDSHNTFTHVLSRFRKFMGDSVLLTWGTTDILTIMENCRYYLGDNRLPFMTKYCDLQRYCENALDCHDKSHQMGLSTCAEHLSIDCSKFELHRALSDARVSLECLKKLYDSAQFRAVTQIVNDEFYRRITFKNSMIYDFKSPLIDKKEMFFICDDCGKKARKRTKWHVKNKSFRADFKCPKCKKEFEGRVFFRLCYDGVKVSKKIVEKPQTTSENKQ